MSTIRDERHKNDLVLRLKRVEGQLRGIQGMIASGEDCEKVAQQISASRRALDKAFFNVLVRHPGRAAGRGRRQGRRRQAHPQRRRAARALRLRTRP
jgi:DNA-binding FrmR family transcriptional regulator